MGLPVAPALTPRLRAQHKAPALSRRVADMRPRIHFDGSPDRYQRMQQLFSPVSRLRVRWADANAAKFRLKPKRLQDWFRKHGRTA